MAVAEHPTREALDSLEAELIQEFNRSDRHAPHMAFLEIIKYEQLLPGMLRASMHFTDSLGFGAVHEGDEALRLRARQAVAKLIEHRAKKIHTTLRNAEWGEHTGRRLNYVSLVPQLQHAAYMISKQVPEERFNPDNLSLIMGPTTYNNMHLHWDTRYMMESLPRVVRDHTVTGGGTPGHSEYAYAEGEAYLVYREGGPLWDQADEQSWSMIQHRVFNELSIAVREFKGEPENGVMPRLYGSVDVVGVVAMNRVESGWAFIN